MLQRRPPLEPRRRAPIDPRSLMSRLLTPRWQAPVEPLRLALPEPQRGAPAETHPKARGAPAETRRRVPAEALRRAPTDPQHRASLVKANGSHWICCWPPQRSNLAALSNFERRVPCAATHLHATWGHCTLILPGARPQALAPPHPSAPVSAASQALSALRSLRHGPRQLEMLLRRLSARGHRRAKRRLLGRDGQGAGRGSSLQGAVVFSEPSSLPLQT